MLLHDRKPVGYASSPIETVRSYVSIAFHILCLLYYVTMQSLSQPCQTFSQFYMVIHSLIVLIICRLTMSLLMTMRHCSTSLVLRYILLLQYATFFSFFDNQEILEDQWNTVSNSMDNMHLYITLFPFRYKLVASL